MGADVGQQVVDHLSQPAGIASNGDDLADPDADRTARIDGLRSVDRREDHLGEIDRLLGQWSMFVEPCEQEEVIDEARHPAGLAADARHGPIEVLRPVAGPVFEQLGVGGCRGDRGAQLVRRVGHESAHTRLRGAQLLQRLLAFLARQLEPVEHRVQRSGEVADLGGLVAAGNAEIEVAVGDRRRARLDTPQRAAARLEPATRRRSRRPRWRRGCRGSAQRRAAGGSRRRGGATGRRSGSCRRPSGSTRRRIESPSIARAVWYLSERSIAEMSTTSCSRPGSIAGAVNNSVPSRSTIETKSPGAIAGIALQLARDHAIRQLARSARGALQRVVDLLDERAGHNREGDQIDHDQPAQHGEPGRDQQANPQRHRHAWAGSRRT